MAELFTVNEIERYLREEVMQAGGARKWCRKNNVQMGHALHMIENGSAATLDQVYPALGFKRVVRYEPITPKAAGAGCAALNIHERES